MSKKEEKKLHAIIKKLFTLLGVEAEFTLEEGEDGISLNLETQDSGMLIGYHGETLEALQLIISLCLAKETHQYVRVFIEIGDYRKNRTEYLKNLLDQTKQKVLSDQKEATIPFLKSWERRIVHTLLQDDNEVTSESVGQGRDRTLVIRPKN